MTSNTLRTIYVFPGTFVSDQDHVSV